MRDAFLKFEGAMTCEDVAKILRMRPEWVRQQAKAGKLPRIPNMRFVRFDPLALVDVLCPPQSRSVTIENRILKVAPKKQKGVSKCL